MTTFTTSRLIAAPVEQVYAALSTPARLARWWGPAGFTNTFDVCEFKTGGRWSFTMHGPDGKSYANESIFTRIEPLHEVAIEHLSEPHFHLTITLTAEGNGTRVNSAQTFDTAQIATRVAAIVLRSNEQNLDRLAVEVGEKMRLG